MADRDSIDRSVLARQRGQTAEVIACRYLLAQGLVLLERNYYCRWGEIDLIMRDGKTVVFVEVRYRSNRCFTTAAESIDYRKQKKLILTAAQYLQKKGLSDRCPVRFDVVTMRSIGLACESDLEWLSDAFQA